MKYLFILKLEELIVPFVKIHISPGETLFYFVRIWTTPHQGPIALIFYRRKTQVKSENSS